MKQEEGVRGGTQRETWEKNEVLRDSRRKGAGGETQPRQSLGTMENTSHLTPHPNVSYAMLRSQTSSCKCDAQGQSYA